MDLAVADPEFAVLVGPPSCRQTTTLRMVNGLEDIAEGTILIGGRVGIDPARQERLAALVDRPIVLGIRPEARQPAQGPPPGTTLRAGVELVESLGDRLDVHARTAAGESIDCRTHARTPSREGQPIELQVDTERVHFFEPGDEGRNIGLPAG